MKYINRIGIGLLLLLPMVMHAAYNDVSLNSSTVISAGGVSLNVTGTAAELESIVVNADNFVVTLAGTSSISIKSTSRYKINHNAAGRYALTDCTGDHYILTLTVPKGESGQQSVTITPTTTLCSSSTGTSGSRGGGGGGGGRSSVVQTPTVVVPQPAAVAAPKAQASFSWTRDLSRGSEGNDVTKLQELFASDKSIYPEGLVTGIFGPATERAVKRFQAKYGLPQVGRIGPMTREKLGEVYGGGVTPALPAVAAPQAVAAVSGGSFGKAMGKGASGDDVKRLQVILNSDPATRIASEGVGSPGNETTLFGSLTEQAVQKFQVKYGIASPGDPGYGFVGPKTRAKLNELAK